MPNYTIFHGYYCTAYEEVEADSPEEALEQSQCYPSICHQCSDELELGDPNGYSAVLLDGEEVLVTKSDEELRVKNLTDECLRLEAKVGEMKRELERLRGRNA